jgi:hypothetical protein
MLSDNPLLNTLAVVVFVTLCLTRPLLAVVALALWLSWVLLRLLAYLLRKLRAVRLRLPAGGPGSHLS